MHALLVLLILTQLRQHEPAEEARAEAQKAERQVQLVYIPPPPRPRPEPQQPQSQPPAAPLTPGPDQAPGSRARVTPNPEKDPNAPPEAQRSNASAPETSVPPDGGATPKRPVTNPLSPFAPNPAVAESPNIESEAQRIFGRPLTSPGPVSGVRDARPWESPLNWASRGCTTPATKDSTVPTGMGVVQGRVFRENSRVPLPGAHLQILGTPYYTYSDQSGDFRLVFDESLVDNCRTQSVRVWAPGYRARDLILYVGVAQNSDVILQRH